MVVDDSAVVRGLVSRWLNEAGGFEVVATAASGRLAIEALERTVPDIVLLDLEMPDTDGMTALPKLLARRPGTKVVVVSSLTKRNAEASLKCLSMGAVDYLAKPEGRRQASATSEFRSELVEKLRALGAARPKVVMPAAAGSPATVRLAAIGAAPPQCLLIGASTGGPRAVEELLRGLGPAICKLPVLLVQHMPPTFTAAFAEHLGARIGARAREPRDGEVLAPGTVYVAPGGRHMGLRSATEIRLEDGPPVNFCKPAVDVLFKDAAAFFGASAIGVVLTGMGSDGTEGARALVRAGASVIAQDEATSTIWGMPGSIVRAGLARGVLPLSEIGPALRNHIAGALP
jgi:two-component system, chemotaxis family, protein-glutamate methylesterase/glutaminase